MEPALSGGGREAAAALALVAAVGAGCLWCMVALLRRPSLAGLACGGVVVAAAVGVGVWVAAALPDLQAGMFWGAVWYVAAGAVALAVERRMSRRARPAR